MYGLEVYVKEELPLEQGLISKKNLPIFTHIFDWLYVTKCLTSFSFIDQFLHFYAQFLILFHLT